MQERKRQKPSLVLIKELQERSKQCHEFVRSSFRSERIEHPELRKALEHYFSYWNDFTHPGLFSIAFEASGGKPDKALRPQAAIAMIAAGFDIHDDIIDKSAEKHDHQTVFGKFGPDLALLLGNAFAIKGLTLLGQSISNLPRGKATQILDIIKTCLFEVGNAHAIELGMKSDAETSTERYLHVIHMKAASIEADMHVAALIATNEIKQIHTLTKIGRVLGTLATLREEFIDVFDTEELNRRIQTETLPVPVMSALQEARLHKKLKKLLEKGKLTSRDTEVLVNLVMKSKSVGKLKNKMRQLCSEAELAIRCVENDECITTLTKLVRSTLEDL